MAAILFAMAHPPTRIHKKHTCKPIHLDMCTLACVQGKICIWVHVHGYVNAYVRAWMSGSMDVWAYDFIVQERRLCVQMSP